MAASLRAMLALAALLAVAATAAANGDKNFLPYTAPCAGGACSALAALDEIKKCRSDGCSNAKCTTATNNLCTLVKGASAGCDLATRTEVNTKDAALLNIDNNDFTNFYAPSNLRYAVATTIVSGPDVVISQSGQYIIQAKCNANEIAIGGFCPGVQFVSVAGGSFTLTGADGPYASSSETLGSFTPPVIAAPSTYDCIYDVVRGAGGTATGFTWTLCAKQVTYTNPPLVGPSCNSAPFNPFKK